MDKAISPKPSGQRPAKRPRKQSPVTVPETPQDSDHGDLEVLDSEPEDLNAWDLARGILGDVPLGSPPTGSTTMSPLSPKSESGSPTGTGENSDPIEQDHDGYEPAQAPQGTEGGPTGSLVIY